MLGLWYQPSNDPYYDPLSLRHDLKEVLNFLPMEVGGLIAALFALKCIPFLFLMAIIALIPWYNMIYDWSNAATKGSNSPSPVWDLPFWMSILYGILCVLFAYSVDKCQQQEARHVSNSSINFN
jgi:H+/Cl- antiporter ClcA